MTEALKLRRLFAFTEVTLWVLVVMATSGAVEFCAVTNTVALLVRVPFVTVTVMLDLEPTAVLGGGQRKRLQTGAAESQRAGVALLWSQLNA